MSTRKFEKMTSLCIKRLKSYYVLCSSETKCEMSQYFIKGKSFNQSVIPIIVNGIRIFSLYRYIKSNESVNELVITKYGAKIVNKLCDGLENESHIYKILCKYFDKYLTEIQDREIVIDQVSRALTCHYSIYKNKENSVYDTDTLTNKYLCIFYPLTEDTYKGLVATLNRISFYKRDSIVKDQFRNIIE